MLEALNGMTLDMLAAIARKDYEDRRRRTAQGIQNAKAEGKYRGRPADEERNASILAAAPWGVVDRSDEGGWSLSVDPQLYRTVEPKLLLACREERGGRDCIGPLPSS
jgi:hypothetical protein